MHNPWSILGLINQVKSLVKLDAAPSLEERIQAQIDQLQRVCDSHTNELIRLETHASQLDADTIRTVSQSLKQHYDVKQLLNESAINNLHRQLDAHNTKLDTRIRSLQDQIDLTILEVAKLSSRITSLVNNLRNLSETSQ
jgi:chromosome segregation ATPase